MLKREELPECDVATTVQIIGNKWKLLIMRNLLMRPWRFNELRKSLDVGEPESPDGQPAPAGVRRNNPAHGLSGGAAEGGILADGAWRIHAPGAFRNGGLGKGLQGRSPINKTGRNNSALLSSCRKITRLLRSPQILGTRMTARLSACRHVE